MQDEKILPSTATAETPQPAIGEDIKDLVTPGKHAEIDRGSDREVQQGSGRRSRS
jgi:hypothetical protein